MANKKWATPEPDWLPLRQGPFALLIRETEECTGNDEASLRELEEILATKSGAHRVEIDPTTSSFRFYFDGGLSLSFGPPWGLLEERRETISNIEPRLQAETNTEGFVRVSDEEAEHGAKRCDAVRTATGLVWRQYMLRAFDRAVSAQEIVLYARPQTVTAPFEQLPADTWPLFEVVDWQSGTAAAPDGTPYWSIHVENLVKAESMAQSPRRAPTSAIHDAITAAYDAAEAADVKPPNLKQLAAAVLPLLEANGLTASGNYIMQLGKEPRHARRRRARGKTVLNEQ